jgi:tripartite-type tricarboxylate transporter receptor subunit TctC
VRITGWNALFGPPGLAEEPSRAWVAALAALARDPEWLAATRRVGGIPRVLGPEATRGFLRDQVALYRDLARRLGLI